jgi:hypothetical protein
MNGIAVKVGSAGDQEAETGGQVQIVSGRRLGVFRMKGFQRIKACLDEGWDPGVASEQAGMRQRRESACVVNPGKHLGGSGPLARHERRCAAPQPPRERLIRIAHDPCIDQCACDSGAPDGMGTVVESGLEQSVSVQHDAERPEAIDHQPDAVDPAAALLGQKLLKRRALRIDEVTEHVNVGSFADCRHLDARYELDARCGACGCRFLAPCERIVIRDTQHGHPGRRRTGDELARGAESV